MNKHIYIIIGLLIGLLISGVSVYGAGKLYASSIDVDTSKMSELGETSNVNLALNYLYGKAASIKTGGNGPLSIVSTPYNIIGKVYLDPTNLNKTCKTEDISYQTYTGCMGWYIYAEDANTFTMILDRNMYNGYMSGLTWSSAKSTLTNLTRTWTSGLNPRFITKAEVDSITGCTGDKSTYYLDGKYGTDTNWATQVASDTNKSHYGWLFDNLYANLGSTSKNSCMSYGCSEYSSVTGEYYGYWMETEYSKNSYAYMIFYNGSVSFRDEGTATYTSYYSSARFGLRPVITVSKEYFY